jgi:hypothetical protein
VRIHHGDMIPHIRFLDKGEQFTPELLWLTFQNHLSAWGNSHYLFGDPGRMLRMLIEAIGEA